MGERLTAAATEVVTASILGESSTSTVMVSFVAIRVCLLPRTGVPKVLVASPILARTVLLMSFVDVAPPPLSASDDPLLLPATATATAIDSVSITDSVVFASTSNVPRMMAFVSCMKASTVFSTLLVASATEMLIAPPPMAVPTPTVTAPPWTLASIFEASIALIRKWSASPLPLSAPMCIRDEGPSASSLP